MSVIDQIIQLSEGTLESMGYEIVRVLLSGKHRPTLQVMIDRLDGQNINIDDCVNVSHTLSAILDVEDLIRESYQLEVTSPGLDRPLTKLSHFTKFIGSYIKLETKLPINEQRKFQGKIARVQGSTIHLELLLEDGTNSENAFEHVDVLKAKIYHEPPTLARQKTNKTKEKR
jgi:ribosome maturation factor RimP